MFTHNISHTIYFVAILFCAGNMVSAATTDQYIELSAGYARGEFTVGQEANLYRLQLTYGEVYENYDVSATVPYLFLKDNTGNYTGVGDIVLRAGSMLDKNTTSGQGLYGSVAVKLPTASETKGLGTGKIDLGGFLSYTHEWLEMNLTAMGGYILTGDSPDLKYEDILVYSVGISKFITPWYVFGSLEGRQKTLATGTDSLDLNLGFFYHLKAHQFLKAEGYTGLNSTTPDYGISVGIVNWF
jgi:hypothetical protein